MLHPESKILVVSVPLFVIQCIFLSFEKTLPKKNPIFTPYYILFIILLSNELKNGVVKVSLFELEH